MSRPLSAATARAVELVRLGMGPSQAARESGADRVALWRALNTVRCPTCGHAIKHGTKLP